MRPERLTQLADFVETLEHLTIEPLIQAGAFDAGHACVDSPDTPVEAHTLLKDPDAKFNMTYYACSFIGTAESGEETCGTMGCIAGWTCVLFLDKTIPEFCDPWKFIVNWAKDALDLTNAQIVNWAKDALDLTNAQAEHLFHPKLPDRMLDVALTPAVAAQAIRRCRDGAAPATYWDPDPEENDDDSE